MLHCFIPEIEKAEALTEEGNELFMKLINECQANYMNYGGDNEGSGHLEDIGS